ncbi:hypothetical protein LIER_16913 [Lithospermum erythrorhizon]|uniref:RRM domain-containing protein n=1 Tax=Lithospermum erythrorhizon TaxID=34254 RepID=A0AAV3QAT5_LITER
MESKNPSETQEKVVTNENKDTNNSNNEKNHQKQQTPPPPKHGLSGGGQQPWVPPLQYPMVMQHPMMPHYPPPPHYMPYHQGQLVHHQQQSQWLHHQGGGSNGENKTIWVGDLHHWMEEEYLRNCFASTREVASIKVIRNKQTGFSEGYGFVEFNTHAAAEKVLQMYPHSVMPNTDQPFRINWATFSMGDKRSSSNNNNNNNNGSDLSIFVGDLATDVTDALLHETFVTRYPSVKGAKVVIDANTNRSKGYGFVRFGDDNERTQALNEMNGVYCSSRPMRIGPATPRKSGYQQYCPSPGPGGYSNRTSEQEGDSMNTTIFVGGLDPNVSDEDLRQPFSNYGEIVSVKIPIGRGCGFVQFANRSDAEEALQKLNGTVIGKQSVRLSWGRNQGNKHIRADYGTGAYYGRHVYEGYGYPMPPPHDPIMYAAPYGAYPMYATHPHQQQVN